MWTQALMDLIEIYGENPESFKTLSQTLVMILEQ